MCTWLLVLTIEPASQALLEPAAKTHLFKNRTLNDCFYFGFSVKRPLCSRLSQMNPISQMNLTMPPCYGSSLLLSITPNMLNLLRHQSIQTGFDGFSASTPMVCPAKCDRPLRVQMPHRPPMQPTKQYHTMERTIEKEFMDNVLFRKTVDWKRIPKRPPDALPSFPSSIFKHINSDFDLHNVAPTNIPNRTLEAFFLSQ